MGASLRICAHACTDCAEYRFVCCVRECQGGTKGNTRCRSYMNVNKPHRTPVKMIMKICIPKYWQLEKSHVMMNVSTGESFKNAA